MEEYLKEIRTYHLKNRKATDTNIPIATWIQEDIFLDGSIGKSLTIILKTVGCSWAYKSGGCTVCSYLMDSSKNKVSENDIIEQFNRGINSGKNYQSVKIFTSGSFLDDFEVPIECRKYIFKKLGKLPIKDISIESRPEYITDENLSLIREYVDDNINVEIGVGIESTNEKIRNIGIHKGVNNKDIKRAIILSKKYNISIKGYLLIKPPFITEKESINDAIRSGNECINMGVGRISYCPTTIHKGTLLETLWKKDQYRPAFLWSILTILKEVKEKNKNKIIMCDTSGIPTKRGAHNPLNCSCNYKIKEAISDFTIIQDLSIIENILNNYNCCKDLWHEYINYETNNIVPLGNGDFHL